MKRSKGKQVERYVAGGLLTRREAALYLRVSMATLSRWAHLRCGPRIIKMTDDAKSAVRYAIEDLDAFIESRSRPTGS